MLERLRFHLQANLKVDPFKKMFASFELRFFSFKLILFFSCFIYSVQEAVEAINALDFPNAFELIGLAAMIFLFEQLILELLLLFFENDKFNLECIPSNWWEILEIFSLSWTEYYLEGWYFYFLGMWWAVGKALGLKVLFKTLNGWV